jgi:predicted transcriptional regulator
MAPYKKRLTKADLEVYTALVKYKISNDGNTPSVTYLMANTGHVSKSTVFHSLNKLVEFKLITPTSSKYAPSQFALTGGAYYYRRPKELDQLDPRQLALEVEDV